MKISGNVKVIKWSDHAGNKIGTLDEGTSFKGFIPGLSVGDSIEISGIEKNHPKFGRQIEVDQFKFLNPDEDQLAIQESLRFLHVTLELKKRGKIIFGS